MSANEFEREPVKPEQLEPARHFAASYAGEHVAGTIGGTIEVSRDGAEYEITYTLNMDNGSIIDGYYKGNRDYFKQS